MFSLLFRVTGVLSSEKSSQILLNLLYGKRALTSTSQGQIIVNNTLTDGDLYQYRNISAFQPSNNVLHPQMTIRESLTYSANMHFSSKSSESSGLTKDEQEQLVDAILESLQLTMIQHLQTSHPSITLLERKLISLAIELSGVPLLLLLDSPLVGLSARDASEFMHILQMISSACNMTTIVANVTTDTCVESFKSLLIIVSFF
jgi:ABC transport system ATP-binding/permease protein